MKRDAEYLVIQGRESFERPYGLAWLHAILMFVYVYRITGGASSVDVVDGRYVAKHKGQVIRTIIEHEYRMFPNLVTRVMSIWIGMMCVLVLAQFAQVDGRPNGRL